MQKVDRLLYYSELDDEPNQSLQRLWKLSRYNLEEGLKTFEAVRDTANQILLLCNQGRLNRLCAQTYAQISLKEPVKEFRSMERKYFIKVGII